MRKIAFILWGLLLSFHFSWASTFVGNGGNSKDVELQITLMHIQKSLNWIQALGEGSTQTCQCESGFEGHALCQSLKSLSDEQRGQCRKDLYAVSERLLELIKNPQSVQIIWTMESMQVAEKGGNRQAEGVAVPKEKKIFLNREDFLSLKSYERVYLLTHELAHLIPFDGSYVQDDQSFKTFKQVDGGRQFLNALGASVSMKALAVGALSEYSGTLRRSKSEKNHWFHLQFVQGSQAKNEGAFAVEKYSGTQFQYRYQLSEPWGVGLGLENMKGEQTFFGSARTEFATTAVDAGVYYRWMPFTDPFRIWGPSHFTFGLAWQTGKAKIDINDGVTSVKDEVTFSSPKFSLDYNFPLIYGAWLQLGLQYTSLKYEFKEIGYTSEKNQMLYGLGVGYAF